MRTFLGRFLSRLRHFLLNTCKTPHPWLASLQRSGQRLDRRDGSRSIGKIAVGNDVERLAFMLLGKIAVATTMLLNKRLGILLDARTQDLNQIVASRLARIPRAIT